ncbi:MAG TPA: NUDIX domain-containing protein [Herpetosiphonaceae bacterium]|nr:NUDIX domain-containing protein [Herpetosiphonaceae bacterium]
MPGLGAIVAIFQAGRILLTKRDDFEVWCLPGGMVEEGESTGAAAVREAREETGLEVELTRLVGVYSRPPVKAAVNHLILFAARPTGGTLRLAEGEVIEARYFDPGALPEPMLWGHREMIGDALAGVGGSIAKSFNRPWPFVRSMTRQELYELRDRSGLPRHEFYTRHFRPEDPMDQTVEVAPGTWPTRSTDSDERIS